MFSFSKFSAKFSFSKTKMATLAACFTAVSAQAQIAPNGSDTSRQDTAAILLLIPFQHYALDEVEVNATRADARTPIPFVELSKAQIAANNLGADLPILLDQTPSVVTNSDAGSGIGYTGLRIRGSDGTRINVTINGIPVNDAESQGVFWVNMPDLATSAENIQIQRGAGTSTNGAGAFGASINIRTNAVRRKAYAEIGNSIGSFASRRHSVSFGSGLINDRFIFEGRLSEIASNGYIDRASSLLRSYFLTATYVRNNTVIRFNTFSGKERTYQAWGGVPISYIDSLPTYNPYNYKNEVDNYTQTHYQLHFTRYIRHNITAFAAAHYTKGSGYYEQYRSNDRLSNYGLDAVQIGDTTISRSDLIRRRWLDNDFYGGVYSLTYRDSKMEIILGGGWNNYVGAHFGEVIWARYASNGDIGHRYYENTGRKLDGNTYLKINYDLSPKVNLFVDLQHRFVRYNFVGFDNNLRNVGQQAQLHFFNPKAGFGYAIDKFSRAFASFSVANREPNRDDYTQSSPESRPKAESLYDFEAGYQRAGKSYQFAANVFYMYYQNQLVLNGQLNDVGAYIRTNIPQSYRAGLELQGNTTLFNCLQISANAAYSQNKVVEFTEFVDVWDNGSQETATYKNTDIAFSPRWIAGAEIMFFKQTKAATSCGHRFDAAWISKFVSRQYLDNTQSLERSLAGYMTNDLRLRYTLKQSIIEQLDLTLLVRNVFSAVYSPNGFVYRFRSDGYNPTGDDPYTQAGTHGGTQGGYYNLIGLYPQAGINFMLGLNLRF